VSGKLHKDLTGRQFDFLTVIRRSEDRGNGKKPEVKWDCQCVCGKIVAVKSYSLLSGHTKSCGCQKIKHGYSNKERLYQTWKNMRRRCFDPKNSRYAQYGGRGITICPEWNDYIQFRTWALNNGYSDDLTIDRKEVNGNYCPENCRWANAKTQANNVSRNHIIEYKDKRMTMSEFADYLGISYSALQHRIERGWNIESIVTVPQRRIG
jgi:hypothetical protein